MHHDEQHKPNDGKCNRCVVNKDDDEDWKCYHQQIITDHVLLNMEEELKALWEAMIYQITQLKESKLTIEDPNPTGPVGLDRKNNINSIHYKLDQRTTQQRAQYSSLLDHKL